MNGFVVDAGTALRNQYNHRARTALPQIGTIGSALRQVQPPLGTLWGCVFLVWLACVCTSLRKWVGNGRIKTRHRDDKTATQP